MTAPDVAHARIHLISGMRSASEMMMRIDDDLIGEKDCFYRGLHCRIDSYEALYDAPFRRHLHDAGSLPYALECGNRKIQIFFGMRRHHAQPQPLTVPRHGRIFNRIQKYILLVE